jgi:hypothetical protein
MLSQEGQFISLFLTVLLARPVFVRQLFRSYLEDMSDDRTVQDHHTSFSNSTGLISFSGSLVEKALEYMSFKKAYENMPPKEEIPVNEFLERIPTEVALEL